MTSFNQLSSDRPYCIQEQFNSELEYSKPKSGFHKKFKEKFDSCHIKQLFLATFPIISWIRTYSLRTDLPGDIVSGITIAIVQLPQTIGSAMLAKVPPVNGIYTSIFPIFIYIIFGTSRHISMGSFVIINIMISQYVLQWSNSDTNEDDGLMSTEPKYTPSQIASAICFNIGMIQLLMYIFRLGILSSLLSEILVSGFTTAAGFTIIISQIGDLFGMKLTPHRGYFQIFPSVINIGTELLVGNFNYVTILISAITSCILLTNYVFITPALSKRCPFPVPAEIICIIFGIIMANRFRWNENYDVQLLGQIPAGLPTMELPALDLIPKLIFVSIGPAIISYTISVSMAISIAQKYNYIIKFNQELLAIGLCNMFASFLPCVPLASSLSRSILQPAVGGKTQMTSLFACLLLICALLWIGPFFENLPVAIVACVIAVTLKSLCMQVRDFPKFWRASHLDGIQWMLTFLASLIIATDIGLAIGLFLSLISLVIREMQPYTCLLGQVPSTSIYLDIKRYKTAKELEYIKIFHYGGSLNFISKHIFRKKLLSSINMELEKEITRMGAQKTKLSKNRIRNENDKSIDIKAVIIDFSAVAYIDPSSIASLKQLIHSFTMLKINFVIAGCTCYAYETIKNSGFSSDLCSLYPTIHDAVNSIQASHFLQHTI